MEPQEQTFNFKFAALPDAGLSLPPKRKRTKRLQRFYQSPFTFPVTRSISEERASISKAGSLSPAGSSDVTQGDYEINEEEDMAHCLMLLARSGHHSPDQERLQQPTEEEEAEEEEKKVLLKDGNDHERVIRSFSSKRFLEITGQYVFQCKTCDKVFPSFQALGGHRASHTKPKTMAPTTQYDNRRVMASTSSSDDNEEAMSLQLKSTGNSSSFIRTCNNGRNSNINNTKQAAKVHECSICGAEFSSGQALGGHMRRHRPLTMNSSAAATNLALTPESDQPSSWPRSNNKVLSLQLDLNLPVPEYGDIKEEAGFSINQAGGQELREGSGSLVFSFPVFGCLYF
ncbi:hypothetical protein SAY87_023089 [Trapa incisa]|uniref:C2H2-type domain-containing protein n=1 Tax=Trapa incisa TaxID=236973 RepID=A0AAN7K1Z0_9MYRT|nr:hypothetical protein SAY87_023089 [Trapa incisa]